MKPNILVIDDMPENLQILIGMLSAQGYEVRAFAEGTFALESIRANPPDLILLDVRMPGTDGYTLCEHVKADPRTREIPVLFISAYGEVEDKIKGFRVGGVDYITKPFHVEEVLARVRTHLGLSMMHKELQQEIQRRSQAEEELQVLNEQLRDANRGLQEANAGKDTFMSILAHDLRGPFTSLLGLSEALVANFDEYDTDRKKKMLNTLHASSKNVYALLNDLLEWSRLERGVLDYHPDTLMLSPSIAHVMVTVQAAANHKQITLRNSVPEQLTGYADEQMLHTILRNLLTNAVKFTDAHGMVEVSAHSLDDHEVEIRVTDTGVGMDEETIAKLFRIDAKASRPGTNGEKGTGLGLVLCKEFVKKNGGRLRVESQVGQGTICRLTLPGRAI
jgi:signal transduction histidine kinase